MEAADALVALQPHALAQLPRALRRKAHAIVQSAPAMRHGTYRKNGVLRVCVLGHLRPEKDPMRAAYAVRALDAGVRVKVLHAGAILTDRFDAATQREMQRNARYRYLGELSRPRALRLLANSDLLVQSSRMEGGANTVCEAIAGGTPVLASRISGNIGILGRRYPGLYDLGDTKALARLIARAAEDPAFYARLQQACEKLRPLVDPKREQLAWRGVLSPWCEASRL